MKPRTFAALVLVAGLALLFAVASYVSNNRWSQAKVSGAPLFPGLATEAGKIQKIEIKQGDKTLTLTRDKDTWSLADRGGYPVKAEAVRALLVKLAEAELVEPKTRNKDRYALLELEEPTAKDAKSRDVRLLDDKGGVVAQAVIGKKRLEAFGASKGGTYVRKPGDAQTWLANTDLDTSLGVRDWALPHVMDLATVKISGITVEMPGEEPLKIERGAGDAGQLALVGIPAGKKLKSGNDVEGISRAIAQIDLEDVRKLSATPAGDVSVVTIKGEGGFLATLRIRKQGEDYWLSLSAAGTGENEKKLADDITRRTQGWEYKIPASKAQAILKRRADLLEASQG